MLGKEVSMRRCVGMCTPQREVWVIPSTPVVHNSYPMFCPVEHQRELNGACLFVLTHYPLASPVAFQIAHPYGNVLAFLVWLEEALVRWCKILQPLILLVEWSSVPAQIWCCNLIPYEAPESKGTDPGHEEEELRAVSATAICLICLKGESYLTSVLLKGMGL